MKNSEKIWLSPTEIAGLPGMPGTRNGVNLRAKRQQWPSRARRGRGGGVEYPVDVLSMEAKAEVVLNGIPGKRGSVLGQKNFGEERNPSRSESSAIVGDAVLGLDRLIDALCVWIVSRASAVCARKNTGGPNEI